MLDSLWIFVSHFFCSISFVFSSCKFLLFRLAEQFLRLSLAQTKGSLEKLEEMKGVHLPLTGFHYFHRLTITWNTFFLPQCKGYYFQLQVKTLELLLALQLKFYLHKSSWTIIEGFTFDQRTKYVPIYVTKVSSLNNSIGFHFQKLCYLPSNQVLFESPSRVLFLNLFW